MNQTITETDQDRRARLNRLYLMAEAVLEARSIVLQDERQKGKALALAMEHVQPELAEEIRARGTELVFTGDNWLWTAAGEDLYPDLSASVALTERDEEGRIIAVALAGIYGPANAVVADGDAVFGYDPNWANSLEQITGVDPEFLEAPPRAFVFGQKSTPHWVTMSRVITRLNGQGLRTQNDCGPFYGLMGYFNDFLKDDGIIRPMNAVYCEPFANKPKEEIMAFVAMSLNASLPESARFAVLDMSGAPLFRKGVHARDGVDETYASSGYVIAPTTGAAKAFLVAMRDAFGQVLPNTRDNEKLRLLSEQLRCT